MEQLKSTAFTTGSSNISATSGPSSPGSWDSVDLAAGVVMSLCFLVGVPGNIAVIILRPNWEHLCSLSQHLMMNLAVSDLLYLITLPLWIYSLVHSWIFSLTVCKMLTYVVDCSVCCSLLTVTTLSIHRYLQVVRQQRWLDGTWEKRRLLVLLWLVATAITIPNVMNAQLSKDGHSSYCKQIDSSENQSVAPRLIESILGFVIPFSFVTFAYIRIYRSVNQAPFFNHSQTTWLVTSIMLSFFVLWTPYHVVNVLVVASVCLKKATLLKTCTGISNIAKAVTYLYSCLNPVLYAFATQRICIMCKNVFKHKCCCAESQTTGTS